VKSADKELIVFALAHCGAIGTMNRNRGNESDEKVKADRLFLQKKDWKRVEKYI